MKLNKAAKLLTKINVLFDSIKGEEELSLLELDLLKEYVRKFYNKLDAEKINNSEESKPSTEVIEVEIKEVVRNAPKPQNIPVAKKVEKKVEKKIAVISEPIAQEKPVPVAIPKPQKIERPEPVIQEVPVIVPQEIIVEVPQTMIEEVIPSFELEIEESPVTQAAPVVKPRPVTPQARTKPAPKPVVKPSVTPVTKAKNPYSYDELFEFEEANSLSQKLSTSKIQDIRNSMGLNERVLTINELFNGNALTFDKVLKRLNTLDNFKQAQVFLTDEVIPQFNWDSDKKVKKAKVFIKLIRRRY